MDILNFTMPPFLRIQWASKEIKEKYEPMFHKAKNVFQVLEQESVKHGLRSCTTSHVDPHDFDRRQQEYIKQGLVFLPIQKVGMYNGFSNYHPEIEEGKPWQYYGVVADSIEHAEQFAHASSVNDHTLLGKLLGYPTCCTKHLNDVWLKEKITDTTFQQALNTSKEFVKVKEEKFIRLKNLPWESNNILRPFLLGPIFHMKCSLDCSHTQEIALKWIELGKKLNVDGMKEMEMFLRMPAEWDALKGIAYVRTPLFKASFNSVTCTERHIVQVEGSYYPEDAPKGLSFPWNEFWNTVSKNGNKLTLE